MEIAKILAEKKADPRKVVLISFNKEVVKACSAQLPAFSTCWISELKGFNRPGMSGMFLAEIAAAGSQGLAFKADAPVSAEWLQQARGADGLLMAWTVDQVAVARRVAALGVDFIVTNRPRDLRREMAGN